MKNLNAAKRLSQMSSSIYFSLWNLVLSVVNNETVIQADIHKDFYRDRILI